MLPLFVGLCLYLMLLKMERGYQRVESQNGVVDLRGIDFAGGGYALAAGKVEYVAGALLAPEDFDSGEVQVGQPESPVATSRLVLLLPEDRYYAFCNPSRGFGDVMYVNGKLLTTTGVPAATPEGYTPGDRYIYQTVLPENGRVEIVLQSTNYVHHDMQGHSGWYVGHDEQISQVAYRRLLVPALSMGMFLMMAITHLALFLMMPRFNSNLWYALVCFTGFVRTGATGVKALGLLVPGLGWRGTFRLEYMAIPLLGLLVLLSLQGLFPGVVQKGVKWALVAATAASVAYCLLADTVLLSRSLVALQAVPLLTGVYLTVRLAMTVRHPNTEQRVVLASYLILPLVLVWDTLFYRGILPAGTFPLGEAGVMVFVLCCTYALLLGTLRRLREASLNEQRAMEEAEALRLEAERRQALLSTIPPDHLVARGGLSLNTLAQQAFLDGTDMLLTPKEFALLLLLVQNEDDWFAPGQLYEQVWKKPASGDTRTVVTSVSRLRKKLAGGEGQYQIVAKRGRGYSFAYAPATGEAPPP